MSDISMNKTSSVVRGINSSTLARKAPIKNEGDAPKKTNPNVEKPKATEIDKALGEISLKFDVQVQLAQDENTGKSVVKIFSNDGSRLLRQFPPESALKMAASIRQGTLNGLLDQIA